MVQIFEAMKNYLDKIVNVKEINGKIGKFPREKKSCNVPWRI